MQQPSSKSESFERDLDGFRLRVQTFLDETGPTILNRHSAGTRLERARLWRKALVEAQLAGLTIPTDYGGQGLSRDHQDIWDFESVGKLPTEQSVYLVALGMAGPMILEHGSEDLKQKFLKPGLAGDHLWCQLFSEPGAGSDLASLSTRAIRDGDEWVVTGQKVWTSGAQHAEFGILLARTDPDAPKHRGISLLVVPMDSPGITVRPLRQMTGDSEFNEVFFDEARLPADWVIGEVNDGWRMGVAVLAHERVLTGVRAMANTGIERLWGRVPIPYAQLVSLALQRERLTDPIVRDELVRIWIGERLSSYLRGRGAAVHPSIGKLLRSIQGRRAADLAARLMFPASPAWEDGDADATFFNFQILNYPGMRLGGGTDEIQHDQLGEKVLGLPREPSVDRNVAFRDLLIGSVETRGADVFN